MNDKQKIRFLEGQVELLRKALDDRNKPRKAFCERVAWEDMIKGFDYPVDTLHTFVDPRDYSLILIRPKPEKPLNKATPETKG